FELLWDSPLLKAFFWGLGYEDLDGDGTKELIFRSDLSREGRIYAIFDLKGRELSRQNTCETTGVFDAKSGICAIVCEGIDIAPASKNGSRDLFVYGKADAPPGSVIRMRLIAGRLVVVPSFRPQIRR